MGFAVFVAYAPFAAASKTIFIVALWGWETLWYVIANHWGKILLLVLAFFGWILYFSGQDARDKKEKGEKAGLHTVKPPKSLTVLGRLNSGDIADFIPQIQKSVFTVKTLGGHGSGFLVGKNSWLLTNAHVVGDEEYVLIKPCLSDKEISGRVMIKCEDRDAALVKMPHHKSMLPLPMRFTIPGVGDDVYVFGTPLDEALEGTLTKGVVSAIRNIEGMEYIQSDVTIHPGNSGGPLLDKCGNVVGVAVSGVQVNEAMANLNHFIPIKSALASLKIRISSPLIDR